MARKIAVKFNGKTIGTRTTDRPYTHALVLTDFNPELARKQLKASETSLAEEDARNWLHYNMMATMPVGTTPDRITTRHGRRELAWPWPITQEDHDKAVAYLAGANVAQFQERMKVERAARLEEHIAKVISRGAEVLSYHGSRDLAFKARDAATNNHPCYLVLVEPTELILTGRDAIAA